MKEALFVVVNYRNSKEVIEYYNHITKIFNNEFDFIIVNNSEEEEELNKLNKKKKNVFLFTDKKNLGYFTAMNFGIKRYSEYNQIPKWVILCNTDIEVCSKNMFDILNDIEKKENPLCIAPKIISYINNKNQNPHIKKRVSYKYLKLLGVMYSNFILYKLFIRLSLIKRRIKVNKINDIGTDNKIYAPHGSFIIIKNTFLDLRINLDYNELLYGEEIYLAEQIFRMGENVIYTDKIKIIHKEHSITGTLSNNKKRILKYNSIKFLINFFKR